MIDSSFVTNGVRSPQNSHSWTFMNQNMVSEMRSVLSNIVSENPLIHICFGMITTLNMLEFDRSQSCANGVASLLGETFYACFDVVAFQVLL